MVDCRIWHYKINMEKLGINGYWFDNAPITAGGRLGTDRAYLTADGIKRPNYNIFERHDLFRRLDVIYREAGKEPYNLISYSPDFSFAHWIWMIEMDAYVRKGETMFDTLRKKRFYDIVSRIIGQENKLLDPIARHRAMTRMRSVPGATASNVKPGEIKASRSVLGLGLLHDFGVQPHGVDKEEHARWRKVLNDFGFSDPGVKYLPYWRNSKYVKVDDSRIFVSLFKHPKTKEILGVMCNPEEDSINFKLLLNTKGIKTPVLENPEDHSKYTCTRKKGTISTKTSLEDCSVSLFLLREKGVQD